METPHSRSELWKLVKHLLEQNPDGLKSSDIMELFKIPPGCKKQFQENLRQILFERNEVRRTNQSKWRLRESCSDSRSPTRQPTVNHEAPRLPSIHDLLSTSVGPQGDPTTRQETRPPRAAWMFDAQPTYRIALFRLPDDKGLISEEGTVIRFPFNAEDILDLRIEYGVMIGPGCEFGGAARLYIGKDTYIGRGVRIIPGARRQESTRTVTIGSSCIIGEGSTIYCNYIGPGSRIIEGAVVHENIWGRQIAGGDPASVWGEVPRQLDTSPDD